MRLRPKKRARRAAGVANTLPATFLPHSACPAAELRRVPRLARDKRVPFFLGRLGRTVACTTIRTKRQRAAERRSERSLPHRSGLRPPYRPALACRRNSAQTIRTKRQRAAERRSERSLPHRSGLRPPYRPALACRRNSAQTMPVAMATLSDSVACRSAG